MAIVVANRATANHKAFRPFRCCSALSPFTGAGSSLGRFITAWLPSKTVCRDRLCR
ncbi:hypothetical protein RHECNPAF_14110047 [Rhizobium etli CNPAF512]|nr:hypothetical protein RHECNPAF_14110047 [Rhizobium etli CNPAF512]